MDYTVHLYNTLTMRCMNLHNMKVRRPRKKKFSLAQYFIIKLHSVFLCLVYAYTVHE